MWAVSRIINENIWYNVDQTVKQQPPVPDRGKELPLQFHFPDQLMLVYKFNGLFINLVCVVPKFLILISTESTLQPQTTNLEEKGFTKKKKKHAMPCQILSQLSMSSSCQILKPKRKKTN